MATRLYGANPGYNLEQVTEAAGSATSAHNVELTVDLATTVVADNGTTRAIQKQEVLIILDLFAQYITRGNWLPA
jgi:hypothetical protein